MRLMLIVLGAALAAEVWGQDPTATPPRIVFAIYSWHPQGEPWHFVVVADTRDHALTTDEVMHAPPIVGMDALKSKLASLPATDWAIMWRTSPPDKYIQYPPHAVIEDIQAYAKRRGLNVEIAPTLSE